RERGGQEQQLAATKFHVRHSPLDPAWIRSCYTGAHETDAHHLPRSRQPHERDTRQPVLALQRDDDAVSFPVEGFDGGSVSMLAVRLG
ncbi:MAG: hypothetical protein ACT4O5_11205, partial [Gammaproteobacteria bacterium]